MSRSPIDSWAMRVGELLTLWYTRRYSPKLLEVTPLPLYQRSGDDELLSLTTPFATAASQTRLAVTTSIASDAPDGYQLVELPSEPSTSERVGL